MNKIIPVIGLMIFIFFAGLKTKQDVQPCTDLIEMKYYKNGKLLGKDRSIRWTVGQLRNDKYNCDSISFQMYLPPKELKILNLKTNP